MTSIMMPPQIHVLAKPTGAICNLHCSYCFFLGQEPLSPDGYCHLGDEVFPHCVLSQPSLVVGKADSDGEWSMIMQEIKSPHLMRAIIVSWPMTMTEQ
jgi:hypothetical protein